MDRALAAVANDCRRSPSTTSRATPGAPLGHGVELLVALPILAGLGLGLLAHERASRAERCARRRRTIPLAIAAGGVLIPIVLVAFGADYLAPRNLVAAMIPLTAVIAVVVVWPGTGRAGSALAATIALGVPGDLARRRSEPAPAARQLAGSRRGAARRRRGRARSRPSSWAPRRFEYYLPGLHDLRRGSSVRVSEIDETGYAPAARVGRQSRPRLAFACWPGWTSTG